MKTKVWDWTHIRENAEHIMLFVLIMLSFIIHDLWSQEFGWREILITLFFLYMVPKCVKALNKIEVEDITNLEERLRFKFIFWLLALMVMFMFPFASLADFVAGWASWLWTIVYISTYVYNMKIDFSSWSKRRLE